MVDKVRNKKRREYFCIAILGLDNLTNTNHLLTHKFEKKRPV
jgi:hypothetical protein